MTTISISWQIGWPYWIGTTVYHIGRGNVKDMKKCWQKKKKPWYCLDKISPSRTYIISNSTILCQSAVRCARKFSGNVYTGTCTPFPIQPDKVFIIQCASFPQGRMLPCSSLCSVMAVPLSTSAISEIPSLSSQANIYQRPWQGHNGARSSTLILKKGAEERTMAKTMTLYMTRSP